MPGDNTGSAAAPVRVLLDGEPFTGAARRIAAELAEDTVASRLAEQDPSVWGSGAAGRVGWPGLARSSRPLTGQITALRDRFAAAGAHRVLLVGTPDAVLAARLLAGTDPVRSRLAALDSADPVQVAEALSGETQETVLVVADAGGDDPVVAAVADVARTIIADEIGTEALAARTVHVTEPGSRLDTPDPDGVTVVTLDADVPGLFAALGPLGLVPAGLAGVDVGGVLAAACAAGERLSSDDPDNPALLLAGALVAARGSVLALRDAERNPGLTGWLVPLLTAAGLVPVPAGPDEPLDPAAPALDRIGDGPSLVEVHADGDGPAPAPDGGAIRTTADPGALVVLWQNAAALAARALGTDPFVPAPPVARAELSAETAAASTQPEPEKPAFVDEGVAVYADPPLPDGVTTVAGALEALAGRAGPDGYLALSAWLDPESDASLAVLAGPLADRTGLPVAFGWAPGRCAGDTGADDRAVHCHLTGDAADPRDEPDHDHDHPPATTNGNGHGPVDIEIGSGLRFDPFPGTGSDIPAAEGEPEPSGLDSLHAAQADAVVAEQRRRGRPVLRLHLADRLSGLITLARAAQGG
ncbi:hypothetical protein [Pseudonocardia phyllosphaerae]|uniref:hypothetical protein n=1 Tax=Pseudonocardia phyllosphaerae TaxID=3390502 RepID=UPI00397B2385